MERLPKPADNMEAEIRAPPRELVSFFHEITADDSRSTAPLMSFWRTDFRESVSFAGRLLIGVEFREAVFKNNVDFSGAVLVGNSELGNAVFKKQFNLPARTVDVCD